MGSVGKRGALGGVVVAGVTTALAFIAGLKMTWKLPSSSCWRKAPSKRGPATVASVVGSNMVFLLGPKRNLAGVGPCGKGGNA